MAKRAARSYVQLQGGPIAPSPGPYGARQRKIWDYDGKFQDLWTTIGRALGTA